MEHIVTRRINRAAKRDASAMEECTESPTEVHFEAVMFGDVVDPHYKLLHHLPANIRARTYQLYGEYTRACDRVKDIIIEIRSMPDYKGPEYKYNEKFSKLEVDAIRAVLDTLAPPERLYFYHRKGMVDQERLLRQELEQAAQDRKDKPFLYNGLFAAMSKEAEGPDTDFGQQVPKRARTAK
jgi:hypothetical protein